MKEKGGFANILLTMLLYSTFSKHIKKNREQFDFVLEN